MPNCLTGSYIIWKSMEKFFFGQLVWKKKVISKFDLLTSIFIFYFYYVNCYSACIWPGYVI